MLLHTQDFLHIETMLLHFPVVGLSRLDGGDENGGGGRARGENSGGGGVVDGNMCQDLMLEFSQQVRWPDLSLSFQTQPLNLPRPYSRDSSPAAPLASF